jgi:hypothetical protein
MSGDLTARVESSSPSLVHGQNRQLSMDTSGNTRITPGTLGAGERLQDSATKSYMAVRQEANATIVSLTTAITIGGGVASDTHLMGLMIHTALTGTCAITGFADSAGAAQTYTLPAGSVGYKDFLGALNSAGALTITCSNVVMVLWRPAV